MYANFEFDTLPTGRLGLIALEGASGLGKKVDDWLVQWRKERDFSRMDGHAYEGYSRDTFQIKCQAPRFGSGEGKGQIDGSIRGDDLYILVDVCNYSLTYQLGKNKNIMSPDDHFQDLKRIIAAVGGKARRVNVIMPYLYESRIIIRDVRESLDCATALHELINMGVENIITFDAHDSRIQNATPLSGFETIQPSYQLIKALLNNVAGLSIHKDHFMVVSPDEGSMDRAIYLANVLGVGMGMFYKRLDYTRKLKGGRHPVAAYEFLGPDLKQKDILVVDDMISSGDTMIEVATHLKERGAGRIFLSSTFGHFTDGLEKFDKAFEMGLFEKVFTTNLIYQRPELLEKPWYISVDLSKYIALIIDTLNHDLSVSHLLNPVEKIKNKVRKYMESDAASSVDA